MDKTFYAILEVGRHASGETINAAYETLVKKYESASAQSVPDDEAQNRLKAVREAYRILSNPARKEMYDLALENSEPLPESIAATPFWTHTKLAMAALVTVLTLG